ncbi:MAG TPA: 5-(carboxyamino)imidazole ribonucleotide mutase [Vicinamibacteria bacterium]|jgi:phosphoribosylaminoimidazole carboxylase PurE protein
MSDPRVGILMGSASDQEVMGAAADVLRELDVPYEIGVYSAHRTPDRVDQFVADAPARGIRVLIAGAGAAAHLAGALAARTQLPVIGVPLTGSALSGMDALLATVQMPAGFPVATMAIGKPGATNAGLLAAQILALTDSDLRERLAAWRKRKAAAAVKASEELSQKHR